MKPFGEFLAFVFTILFILALIGIVMIVHQIDVATLSEDAGVLVWPLRA